MVVLVVGPGRWARFHNDDGALGLVMKFLSRKREEEVVVEPEWEVLGRREYSAPRFWRKLVKYGVRLGRKTVTLALVLFHCLRDGDTPAWAKGVIMGSLGYLILPVDAVPDLVPVAGFGDDWAALVAALGMVAMYVKDEHKQRAAEQTARLLGEEK